MIWMMAERIYFFFIIVKCNFISCDLISFVPNSVFNMSSIIYLSSTQCQWQKGIISLSWSGTRSWLYSGTSCAVLCTVIDSLLRTKHMLSISITYREAARIWKWVRDRDTGLLWIPNTSRMAERGGSPEPWEWQLVHRPGSVVNATFCSAVKLCMVQLPMFWRLSTEYK